LFIEEKLENLDEFELIARLCANLPQGRQTILGAGDDCAIFTSGTRQLITIDSMVEGVHFQLGWGTPELLGAKALTVNLSDIAAMGGKPTVCVINLAVRSGVDQRYLTRLYAGLSEAAQGVKVDIIGGNVTRADQLAITIALLGETKGAMRRDGAHPGDNIYVTGTIGDAALGLRILQKQVTARGAVREYLINRFLHPTARIAAAQQLAAMRPLPAAIDISDGLWQDLGHILERSAVGAELETQLLPRSPAYESLSGNNPELALTGGENYELLFCMPPRFSDAILTRKLGVQVTRIGRIVKKGRNLIDGKPRSSSRSARLGGWNQLRTRGG
jgi:thiamine-monophosphate kinase